jgi:hypothetical protein
MSHEEKKMRVYHAVPFIPFGFATRWASFPDEFKLVAEVETDSLDEAFGLTNSGDEAWWLNERVTAHVSPCRSTSVGDVFVSPDGEIFRVLPLGFGGLFAKYSW